jgi:hypothetical protein
MPTHCGECCTNSRLVCTNFYQHGCELDETRDAALRHVRDGKILSLCMIKAVINERDGEIVDMAKRISGAERS